MMMTPLESPSASGGWHVLHLFYTVSHGAWQELSEQQRRSALSRLSDLILEVAETHSTQLRAFGMLTPKADLGFMVLCESLSHLCSIEKRLTLSLGPDILEPVFSHLSMAESTENAGAPMENASVSASESIIPGVPDGGKTSAESQKRAEANLSSRLFLSLPDWPVFCFYPISKRREAAHNWYRLSVEERQQLLRGYAAVVCSHTNRVFQWITPSTGLDDADWGVTLFAKDLAALRTFVEETRFTSLHAEYTDFGQVFVGLQSPLGEIFRQLQLLPSI